MENFNSNLKICIICQQEIKPLGIENNIISDHKERDTQYGYVSITDFKSDLHLKCRITCAIYYVIELSSRWYSDSPYSVTQQNQVAYELIERLKKLNYQELRSHGVYLYGQPGLGKTHLLADLCRHLVERGVRPSNIYWTNTSTILTRLRSSFGKKYEYGEETVQERTLNQLKRKYLFLDDIGTEAASEWAKEILYTAINYRYEEQLPLFISSNLSPQELAEKMGDKFVSRIIEMCKPIKVTGQDMRLQKAESDASNLNIVIPEFSYRMAYWDIK